MLLINVKKTILLLVPEYFQKKNSWKAISSFIDDYTV